MKRILVIMVMLAAGAGLGLAVELPEPQCYVPFDGNSVAYSRGLRHANLNRVGAGEVPLAFVRGREGQARAMRVLGFVSGESPGGMGGVSYFFSSVASLQARGTLAFWWRDAVLDDPFDEVRNHAKYQEYRNHIRNFAFLTPLPTLEDALLINPQILTTADEKSLTFGQVVLPFVAARDRWTHVALAWTDTRCAVFIDGVKRHEFDRSHRKRGRADHVTLFKNLPGWVDEAAIWQQPLAPDAIAALQHHRHGWFRGQRDDNLPRYVDQLAKAASAARPELPAELDWSLPAKPDRETTTASGYHLDGMWRVGVAGASAVAGTARPFVVQEWAYGDTGAAHRRRLEPLPAPTETTPYRKPKLPKDWVNASGRHRNDPILKHPFLWVERDVDIPADWKGNGIYLRVEDSLVISKRADVHLPVRVYLNGEFVGSVVAMKTAVLRLNKHMRFGERNRIQFLVGQPGYWLPNPIKGNVTLERHRNDPIAIVQHARIHPRLQPSRIESDLRLRLPDSATSKRRRPRKLTVSCVLRDFQTGEIVASLPPRSAKVSSGDNPTVSVVHEWAEPIFWNPDQPRLLLATYRLLHRDRVISESMPYRFGFRVIEWDKGRDIHLNGHPVHMRGQSHNGIEPYVGGVPYYKLFGMNASRDRLGGEYKRPSQFLSNVDKLTYLDEVGHFAHLTAPRYFTDLAFDEEAFLPVGHAWSDYIGNHPSWTCTSTKLMSYMPGPWGHPHTIGGKAGKDYDGNRWDVQLLASVREMLRKVESDRPVYSYRGGVSFDFSNALAYYGHRFPLQSREEVPRYWAENSDKPGINNEVGMPMVGDEYLWQRGKGLFTGKMATSAIIEYAAQYLGDEPYKQITMAQAGKLTWADLQRKESMVTGGPGEDAIFWGTVRKKVAAPKQGAKAGDSFAQYAGLKLHESVQKEQFLERYHRGTLCAWRTYGYNYLIHTNFKPAQLLNRREWTAHGKVTFRFNSPVLIYLAGESGHFERKDHAFYAGETVRKQIVCKNDRFSPIDVRLVWSLVDSQDRTVASDSVNVELQPGELKKTPISFTAPTVEALGKFRLVLSAAVNGQTRIAPDIPPHHDLTKHEYSYKLAQALRATYEVNYGDELAIQVRPRSTAAPVPAETKILLVDVVGDTAAMLDKAGVRYERRIHVKQSDLPTYDVIIFGRQSMTLEWEVTIMEYDNLLGRHFQAGSPTVIVFEHDRPNLMGLQLERVEARHAFVRDPEHPALAGLEDDDFANWRGAADLVPPYQDDWRETDWEVGVGYRFPSRHFPRGKVFGKSYRFPLWSGNGMVCTNAFVKPHVGPFRSLLDCGFDLLYSPLIEEKRKRGRIIYCALDVTSRYGTDPAATKLVNQLLGYAADAPEMQWRPLFVLPDTKLFGLADMLELNVSVLPEAAKDWPDNGIVLANVKNPESAKLLQAKEKDIRGFMERGGELVLLWGENAKQLRVVPAALTVSPDARFGTKDPDALKVLRGLGPADMFWRMIFPCHVVAAKGQTEGGLVHHARHGKGGVTCWQVDPELFRMRKAQMRWQWPKVMRALSTMLYNLGASFDQTTGPEGERAVNLYLLASPEFDPYRRVTW